MGITEDITSALRQAGIDDDGSGSALRQGWDYWLPDMPATDGKGVARTPHPFYAYTFEWPEHALAIIDPGMNADQLTAAIWRQCLTRPGDPEVQSSKDAFEVSITFAFCSRAEHMIALVGHTPRDLALYLDDLRVRDPALFALVVAKDFKRALALRPDEKRAPWPAIVERQWKGIEGDYLPPFLVAVLYAELARLANNQAGLLELSFDHGVELTTTQFLDRVQLAGGHHEPKAIASSIEMAPFQSVALGAPDTIIKNLDREAARAWAKAGAASIALAAAERGGIDISPPNTDAAKFLKAAYAASPGFWIEQFAGRAASRQPRPAATRWGQNWRHHGAMGLFEIASTAREWNARYRSSGPKLASLPRKRLAHAISTINFGWVAEFDTAAGLAELKRIAPGSCKHWTAAMVTPLSVDPLLGEKSGDDFLRTIESEVVRRPKSGMLGYTARYHAHLWLDDRGDDILHYRRFQQDARAEHTSAIAGTLPTALQDTARIEPGLVAMLGRQLGVAPKPGQIGHNRPPAPEMTEDPNAAIVAQNLGMMVSALSTNPILEVLMGR